MPQPGPGPTGAGRPPRVSGRYAEQCTSWASRRWHRPAGSRPWTNARNGPRRRSASPPAPTRHGLRHRRPGRGCETCRAPPRSARRRTRRVRRAWPADARAGYRPFPFVRRRTARIGGPPPPDRACPTPAAKTSTRGRREGREAGAVRPCTGGQGRKCQAPSCPHSTKFPATVGFTHQPAHALFRGLRLFTIRLERVDHTDFVKHIGTLVRVDRPPGQGRSPAWDVAPPSPYRPRPAGRPAGPHLRPLHHHPFPFGLGLVGCNFRSGHPFPKFDQALCFRGLRGGK